MTDTTKTGNPREREAALKAELRDLAWELDPITPSMANNVPTWRAAYSDRTSALMAALCQIAYDKFEDVRTNSRENMRLKLAGGGFRLVSAYNMEGGTQAFLAVSDQFAVLAFRGTDSAEDWGVNLNAARAPLDAKRADIKVHQGFLKAFLCVDKQVRDDIDAHVPSTLGLYITGHSLGGAVAQIAAAFLERDNLAACYTFGAPRVGGLSLDREVRCPHYRLVNAWDLVPGVPPPLYNGYLQGGDVRTLRGKGRRPSRHNRFPIMQVLKGALAIVLLPFIRKFFLIEDHMIWNYREKLEAIVEQEGKKPPLDKDLPPMGAAELNARFETALYAALRRACLTLDAPLAKGLAAVVAKAAKAVAAIDESADARLRRAIAGETAFESLSAALGEARTALRCGPTGEVGQDCLDMALSRLGRFEPFF